MRRSRLGRSRLGRSSRSRLQAALGAITAAVVGVVANLSVWFAIRVLFRRQEPFVAGPFHFDLPVIGSIDLLAMAVTMGALVALQRFRVGMFPVLAAAAGIGVLARLVG